MDVAEAGEIAGIEGEATAGGAVVAVTAVFAAAASGEGVELLATVGLLERVATNMAVKIKTNRKPPAILNRISSLRRACSRRSCCLVFGPSAGSRWLAAGITGTGAFAGRTTGEPGKRAPTGKVGGLAGTCPGARGMPDGNA